jgi:hypothetical protein
MCTIDSLEMKTIMDEAQRFQIFVEQGCSEINEN